VGSCCSRRLSSRTRIYCRLIRRLYSAKLSLRGTEKSYITMLSESLWKSWSSWASSRPTSTRRNSRTSSLLRPRSTISKKPGNVFWTVAVQSTLSWLLAGSKRKRQGVWVTWSNRPSCHWYRIWWMWWLRSMRGRLFSWRHRGWQVWLLTSNSRTSSCFMTYSHDQSPVWNCLKNLFLNR